MYEPIERLQAQAQAYVSEHAERGVPLVGYIYGFAPPELLRACGAVPVRVRIAGGYEAQHTGQQLTQGNTCTYCKAIVGSARSAPLDRLALLVSDGLCEALRRAGEVWDVRFGRAVHTLSVPRVGNEETLRHYVAELGALRDAVCALTDRAFDEVRLREEMLDQEFGQKAKLALVKRLLALSPNFVLLDYFFSYCVSYYCINFIVSLIFPVDNSGFLLVLDFNFMWV